MLKRWLLGSRLGKSQLLDKPKALSGTLGTSDNSLLWLRKAGAWRDALEGVEAAILNVRDAVANQMYLAANARQFLNALLQENTEIFLCSY